MLRSMLLAGAAAATMMTPSAGFADEIDDAIEARRSFYQVVKFNMGVLAGMARGATPYDADAASAAADNMHALSKMNGAAMWPMGSSNEDRPGQTRALPVIWSTFPAIGETHQQWQDASAAMAENAGNGLDALRQNMSALGDSCTACHRTYRARGF